jgi:D-glycero-D-manno-heptose 1,7-bisphosphate phosphatase
MGTEPVTARRPAALVDRDGTINVEIGYLDDPDELELIPGAAAALGRLRDLGLALVVVTNQAQIGRGALASERLVAIHDRLHTLLAAEGAEVDLVLHCPHAPEQGCSCRKPAAGMAREARDRLGLDLASSFVIGDHASDMGLARAIGATGILVLTGHGRSESTEATPPADHIAADLAAAADIIAGLVREEATT